MADPAGHELIFGICCAMVAPEAIVAGIFACEALVLTIDRIQEIETDPAEIDPGELENPGSEEQGSE